MHPRNDSLGTVHHEELFGPTSKYAYPNTVPQAKVSSLKTLGVLNDVSFVDDTKPVAFTSANLMKNRRRSHEFDSKRT